jgi:hypothetical protein
VPETSTEKRIPAGAQAPVAGRQKSDPDPGLYLGSCLGRAGVGLKAQAQGLARAQALTCDNTIYMYWCPDSEPRNHPVLRSALPVQYQFGYHSLPVHGVIGAYILMAGRRALFFH